MEVGSKRFHRSLAFQHKKPEKLQGAVEQHRPIFKLKSEVSVSSLQEIRPKITSVNVPEPQAEIAPLETHLFADRLSDIHDQGLLDELRDNDWHDLLRRYVFCEGLNNKSSKYGGWVRKRHKRMRKLIDLRWRLKTASITQAIAIWRQAHNVHSRPEVSSGAGSAASLPAVMPVAVPSENGKLKIFTKAEEQTPGLAHSSTAKRLVRSRNTQSIAKFETNESFKIQVDDSLEDDFAFVIGTPGSTALTSDLDQTVKPVEFSAREGVSEAEAFSTLLDRLDVVRQVLNNEALLYLNEFERPMSLVLDSNTYLPGQLISAMHGLIQNTHIPETLRKQINAFEQAGSYHLAMKQVVEGKIASLNRLINSSLSLSQMQAVFKLKRAEYVKECQDLIAPFIQGCSVNAQKILSGMLVDEIFFTKSFEASLSQKHSDFSEETRRCLVRQTLFNKHFNALITRVKSALDQPAEGLDYQELISTFMSELVRMRMYMEEAYVSEDAYTHVVEVLQKGKDIQLTPRQMLNSAMSNLGYVLVHVTHQSDDILDACLEFKSMAKYADRVRDALCAESFAREACMAAHPGVSLPASVEDINLSATEKALLIANSELLRNIKMEVKNQPHLWKTAILENLRQRYHAYFGRMPNDLNLVDIAAIKRYELILYGDIQKKIDVASVKK